MSDTPGVYDDSRYEETARADYLSALIDQERLEHAQEVAAKDACIAELAERLNTAEAKLYRLGYERECSIPACNCGYVWTHRRAEI